MRRRSPRRNVTPWRSKIQDLDGDLAAVVEPIAEFGSGELSVRGVYREIGGYSNHFRDGAAQEEVIMGDLDDLPETAE